MARYKPMCYEQDKFVPISFSKQILPGMFEYTLNYLIDNIIDISVFDERYQNDATGAPAYDPAVLLKIVLYGYARGLLSSREIERACRENVVFMALSADTHPHFTTIAHFISSMGGVVTQAQEAGVRGAADAAKQRERDTQDISPDQEAREQHYRRTLRRQIRKLKAWLAEHDDKIGKSGKPVQSNVTDNESAKMKTSHGVIQGYVGVAAVDARHQVVVHAEAYGAAQEHDLLLPMVEGVEAQLGKSVWNKAKVTADAGFHTEANLEQLQEQKIDAYLADNRLRKRDPRFLDTEKYRVRHKQDQQQYFGTKKRFTPRDFHYDAIRQTCTCPAGKLLYRSGTNIHIKGYLAHKFKGTKRDCLPSPLRSQCLKYPDKTPIRQVAFFQGQADKRKVTLTQRMKEKIDSPLGRLVYDRRLGTVEPVFGNHRNHGRDRFTLRGKIKATRPLATPFLQRRTPSRT